MEFKYVDKNRINKKFLIIMVVSVLTFSSLMGCTFHSGKKAEDGRKYGGLIKVKTGEVAETAFFDFKVDEAIKYDTFEFEDGKYEAISGETYLLVKVTIENTYEKDLPMSIRDFVLDFDGNQSKKLIAGYGKSDLKKDQYMDNVFTLKKGESITKSILFSVKDKDKYQLKYNEFYEDEFKGNTYSVDMEPTKK